MNEANLQSASLFSANLKWTELAGANVTGAHLGRSSIADCDLSQTLGLDAVVHHMYSSIGTDTMLHSLRNADATARPSILTFFRSAIEPELLEELEALLSNYA